MMLSKNDEEEGPPEIQISETSTLSEIPDRELKNRSFSNYHRRSSIDIGRIDASDPIFRGEDPALVDITLTRIQHTDKDGDGRLDIHEVATAILGAAKDARHASKKEKKLKHTIVGLSSFLAVFAVIFLVVQGQSLGKSINEAKITSINGDAYGNAHLQDKSGSDLSTRSFGDKFVVENKLDIYSGRMLNCIPPSTAALMTADVTNGVEANIVTLDADGIPVQGIALSGDFEDSTDTLHFGDNKVKVIMDSDACNDATADPQDDSTNDISQGGEDIFNRHLDASHSGVDVLAKNRGLYANAMRAIHEGRLLTDESDLPVELPPWNSNNCDIMPADQAMIKEATDGIACPALRFAVKKALQDQLFELCGYGPNDYMVDVDSMKKLISEGKGAFAGFKTHKIMTNNNNLSAFDRAFSGAISAQSVGVLKHQGTGKCINIQDYQFDEDESVRPATSSNIDMSNSCSGKRQRWKLQASPDDASIRIHNRRSMGYCLSLDAAGVGVEFKECTGESVKWKLDSSGRIKQWGGEGCLHVDASSSISLQVCSNADDSQVWVTPPIFNAAHIEFNFDHSASSGIIGAATKKLNTGNAADEDNESFNQNKYDEFLGKLCDCSDITSLSPDTVFTEVDVGRAVNHFGAAIDISTTNVGAFSWAILSFEWGNAFSVFKKDGTLPLSTFEALFLPDDNLIAKGMLDATNAIVPDIQRDVIGDNDVHYLSNTFEAMNIQISCNVKAQMDAAVTACNCASSPQCGACGFHGLFTDLCGDGYTKCLASGC